MFAELLVITRCIFVEMSRRMSVQDGQSAVEETAFVLSKSHRVETKTLSRQSVSLFVTPVFQLN